MRVKLDADCRCGELIMNRTTQLQILIFLVGRGKAGMRVKQIAAYLGVSQPTGTDSINALTCKSFVEKLADPSDARAVAVAATAEGEVAVVAPA